MIRTSLTAFLTTFVLAGSASAQSLTPEELQGLIDERLNTPNPYQALLADPDPERSLAAMEIMLESGDPDLTSMALEFGLLSPNPAVRRIAVEGFFRTQPVLAVKFDGSQASEERRFRQIVDHFDGTIDASNLGYVEIGVGPLREDGRCFVEPGRDTCRVTINNTGVFLTVFAGFNNPILTARLTPNDSGQLVALATLYGGATAPLTIQVLN